MFGLLCEGVHRITCEPCDSNDNLSVVFIDSWGDILEKVLCEHCKDKIILKECIAWE